MFNLVVSAVMDTIPSIVCIGLAVFLPLVVFAHFLPRIINRFLGDYECDDDDDDDEEGESDDECEQIAIDIYRPKSDKDIIRFEKEWKRELKRLDKEKHLL